MTMSRANLIRILVPPLLAVSPLLALPLVAGLLLAVRWCDASVLVVEGDDLKSRSHGQGAVRAHAASWEQAQREGDDP